MMETGSERQKEEGFSSEEPKESYFGSVRFFKHLILTVVALLIIVPIVSLSVVSVKYRHLKREMQMVQTNPEGEMQSDDTTADGRETLSIPTAGNNSEENDTTSQKYVSTQDGQDKTSQDTDSDKSDADEPDTDDEEIPFTVDLDDWKYILVNESHWLPEDYSPKLVKTRHGQRVDARIKEPLEQLLDAAKADGHNLLISSAYRSIERQAELTQESIQEKVAGGQDYQKAFWSAKKSLAMAGTSEHHTGLAVDLVGMNYQALDAEQADTPEAKWLAEHACEYGFVLRFPKDKEDITGKIYESWHFRYVGEEAAVYMKENNLCLEEFVALQEKAQNIE